MKPFTEFHNDALVQASQSVLSKSTTLFEQNDPKPIKHSDVQAGDTVEWYNGPITFREKVFEKNGKLYVAGSPGRAPILVSSIRLQLHLAQKNNENAKAVRAAKREVQLLKTREKSLADKAKRKDLTGGQSLKFVEASSTSESPLLDDLKKAAVAYEKQRKIFDKEEMELVKRGRLFDRIRNDILDNLSKDEMPDGLEDYLNNITIRTYVYVPSNQMYTR